MTHIGCISRCIHSLSNNIPPLIIPLSAIDFEIYRFTVAMDWLCW